MGTRPPSGVNESCIALTEPFEAAVVATAAEREKLQADDEALKLVARRAGGSMRDSQSLLDQLLASCAGKLTTEQVNAVLGTAGDERVTELAAAILKHDTEKWAKIIRAKNIRPD